MPGNIGIWLFGIAALVWTVDRFVGAYLTLPRAGAPPRRAGGHAGSLPGGCDGGAAPTSSTSTCTEPAAFGCGRGCWCSHGPASGSQEREIASTVGMAFTGTHFAAPATGRYGGASTLLDARTGALRAIELPDRQRIGVQFSDWLFALHFGAVWGWPMQVFVCLMGWVIVMPSATGIYLWWQKRRGRLGYEQIDGDG